MPDTTTENPTAEDATKAAVTRALEILQGDPRTAEMAAFLPSAMQMMAASQGVDISGGVPAEQVADVFQAITDAWQAATA